jgi:hypothetical protein
MTTFLINGFSFNKISVGAKNTWAEMAGRDSSLALGMTAGLLKERKGGKE